MQRTIPPKSTTGARAMYFRTENVLAIPGPLVLPVDPALSTRVAGKPYHLFESAALRAFGAQLLDEVTLDLNKHIPKFVPTSKFPYRESSGKSPTFMLSFLARSTQKKEHEEDTADVGYLFCTQFQTRSCVGSSDYCNFRSLTFVSFINPASRKRSHSMSAMILPLQVTTSHS